MFQGFSQNAIDFLWGISLNNERGWFMAHKQDFTDYVDIPMRELGKAVFSALAEEYPKQDWRLHVCRIYRDARRLHGRGPYKEHLWFTIERPHERFGACPRSILSLRRTTTATAAATGTRGAATMAKLRARIDNDPKPLERLARRLNKSKFVLSGEEFKRPKGDAGKLLNPWYNRKNIAIGYDDNPEGVLFTPQLKDNVLDGFRFLMPYYQYLDTLAGDMEPNR